MGSLQESVHFQTKGDSFYHQGMNKRALVYYNRAMKLNPKDVSAIFNKSLLLNVMGKRKEAVECIQRAISLVSNSSRAYYNKGTFLWGMGRNEEALD